MVLLLLALVVAERYFEWAWASELLVSVEVSWANYKGGGFL